MSVLSTMLLALGTPWLPLALAILTLVTLEAERAWTRARRGREMLPGLVAYLLDGLVILGGALALLAILALLVQAVAGGLALLGTASDWFGRQAATMPLLIALLIVALLVVALARGRRRGVPLGGTADQRMQLPKTAGAVAARASAAPTVASPAERRSAYRPLESVEDEPLPSLAMLHERRKPAATMAPVSFLELGQPSAPAARVPRRRPYGPLLAFLAVALLAAGAVLFRQQLLATFAGAAAPRPAAFAGAPGLGTTEAGSQNMVANVDVAVVPVAAEPRGDTRRVASDVLNLRAGPGIAQELVAVLAKGDTVTLLKEERVIQGTVWVKVRVGDREGWVSQALLE